MKHFYKKRPIIIEAYLWDGTQEGLQEICQHFPEMKWRISQSDVHIETLEGTHIVSSGDYVIKGMKGEFYPCKPDIFLQTYDYVLS